VLFRLGVGAVSGGLATAIAWLVETVTIKLGMQLAVQFTKESFKAALQAVSFMTLVSWLVSSVWTVGYDYLYKGSITCGEMMFDVFVVNLLSALLSTILALGATALGPAGIAVYIIGSVAISVCVSELFARRQNGKQTAEVMDYLNNRLGLKLNEQDEIIDCGISATMVTDPVFLNGQLYERAVLTNWLNHNPTCPLTRLGVQATDVEEYPDFKEIARKFRALHEEQSGRLAALMGGRAQD